MHPGLYFLAERVRFRATIRNRTSLPFVKLSLSRALFTVSVTKESTRVVPTRLCTSLVVLLVIGLWPIQGTAQPAIGGIAEVYANGGRSRPVSPTRFKDFWHSGNHMGLGVGIAGADVFILRMGLRYNNFSLDTAAVRADDQISDPVDLPANDRYYLLGSTLDLLTDVPSPVDRISPYVIVGLTLYYTNLADMEIDSEPTGADFAKTSQFGGGMNVGIGVSHDVSSDVKAFVEYELIGGFLAGDKKVFMPLSVGLAVKL